MANPQVVVDFIADTSGLSSSMKQAGNQSEGLGSRLKGLGRAAVTAGGVAGLAALVGTLKVGIDEMSDAAKVTAQTNAVIKSTGGSAGVTAKQVGDLAGALMRKSGVDDETIQSGENLLLTFTNIQNQTGKGNDIFNRATKTMLDMSVALGQDTKTSAIQLGKALNDPIKGVSSLQRVGVSFTAAQKDQIKALVESGDTLGAQKIILKELNKEFGGSAEAAGKTLPGQINILKESFRNLAGDIVSLLVPALSAITKFFVQNPGLAKAMVIGVLALSAAMVVLNAALAITAAIGSPITIWVIGITAAIAALVAIAIVLYKNWDTVTGVLEKGFNAIKDAGEAVFDWLKKNWPLLLGILTGPIGAAIAIVITHWNTVKSVTTSTFNAIKGVTASTWNAIKSAITAPVDAIENAVSGAWQAIRSVTSNAFDAIRNTIGNVFDGILKQIRGDLQTIRDALYNAWSAVRDTVYDAWHKVADTIGGVFDAIRKQIAGDLQAIRDAMYAAWSAVRDTAYDAWNAVKATIAGVISDIRGLISGLAAWVAGAGAGAMRGAVNLVGGVFRSIRNGASDAVSGVKNAFWDLVKFIRGIAGEVAGAARSVANAIKSPINAVIDAWNGLEFKIPKVSIPSVKIAGHKIGGGSIGGETIGFPNIPRLAAGAVIDQPTLAMVGEAGREIVTPEALLRQIVASNQPEVHVYIGDTELRGLVRVEVADANTGLARTLLAGGVS